MRQRRPGGERSLPGRLGHFRLPQTCPGPALPSPAPRFIEAPLHSRHRNFGENPPRHHFRCPSKSAPWQPKSRRARLCGASYPKSYHHIMPKLKTVREVDLGLVQTWVQTIDADSESTALFEFDSGRHQKSRAESETL